MMMINLLMMTMMVMMMMIITCLWGKIQASSHQGCETRPHSLCQMIMFWNDHAADFSFLFCCRLFWKLFFAIFFFKNLSNDHATYFFFCCRLFWKVIFVIFPPKFDNAADYFQNSLFGFFQNLKYRSTLLWKITRIANADCWLLSLLIGSLWMFWLFFILS